MTPVSTPFDFGALSSGPHLVEKVPTNQIGVDFLNLRTINFALMDSYLPGINNTTRFLRAYTFMSWVWWKAHDVLSKSRSGSVHAEDVRDHIDRIETLFTWGHHRDNTKGLPGNNGLPEGDGPSGLTFAELGRSRLNTSLMAAVQYGPSLKSTNGMGFLVPLENNPTLFRVSEEALPAVEAVDEALRGLPEYRVFNSFKVFQGTSAMADNLLRGWSVWDITPSEKEVFKHYFFPKTPASDASKRRVATIQLLRTILRRTKGVDVQEIRRICISNLLPSLEPLALSQDQEIARLKIAATQIRAAQRLGLEALFAWMEWMVQTGQATNFETLKEIWEASWKASYQMGSTSEHLDRWRGSRRGKFNPIHDTRNAMGKDLLTSMDSLHSAPREDRWDEIPCLAFDLLLRATVLIEAYMEGPEGNRIFRTGEKEGRWAMSEFSDFVLRHASGPISSTFSEVIESCVFSQHLATAVFRDVRDQGRRTQRVRRLRIAQGEFGLEALATRPSELAITGDRLGAALSLMQGCGLCSGPPPDHEGDTWIYRL